ncbi:mitochondrial thiamine pyrophosphate carrier-like [Aricia agestis]|uniref:mitochondrial thiamine pyrophosphate carrier-like n=1 Tax=Aricia agestis TaxID=91739 RepID=UPI001C20B42D|nr:mitochondrial thiamine pyrophosphate carrier-like [Aricia agestis]
MVGYKPDEQTPANQKLIAGALSGVVTRFVTQPLDVLKIKSQLQNKRNKSLTLFGISKSIYLEEGITAFWHGHNVGQVYSIISTSSQFYVYEVSTRYAFKFFDYKYNKFLGEFLCGIWSGCCVATFVTPLDVIRVRQILIKEQYRGFYNGAKAVYRSGGLLAFYEGWFTGILMTGPQMGITFALFSHVQPILLRNFCRWKSGACRHESEAHNGQHLVVATFVAAGAAGLVSKIVTYPLDLARRRLQIATHKANDQYFTPTSSKRVVQCKKLLGCIVECYRSNGIKGLYQGLSVTLLKAQVTTVFTFTTYELVCYLMTDFGKNA